MSVLSLGLNRISQISFFTNQKRKILRNLSNSAFISQVCRNSIRHAVKTDAVIIANGPVSFSGPSDEFWLGEGRDPEGFGAQGDLIFQTCQVEPDPQAHTAQNRFWCFVETRRFGSVLLLRRRSRFGFFVFRRGCFLSLCSRFKNSVIILSASLLVLVSCFFVFRRCRFGFRRSFVSLTC